MKQIIKLFFLLMIWINMQAASYTNELIHQDSPYLLQHAHNPVNWMAWNDKTFEKAKKENKLIFLSIGYSTCHWCHVMERETFTSLSSAKILNNDFIAIKVDKEEMPDVDKYYQNVFHLLKDRSGGWPLNIIMTPQRKVIYADTYIPSDRVYGKIVFNDLLSFISKNFKNNPHAINKDADQIDLSIQEYNQKNIIKSNITLNVIDTFIKNVKDNYDDDYKGIGQAPKFPHASTFDTFLDIYKINKSKEALLMSEEALKAMAEGGIYDQIEGGFFRYSIDELWKIPHFEKMLYTNAELIELYSKMYSIKPTLLFKKVVEDTIKNMNERLLYEGLYKSASDADSEEEEGKYFVFSYDNAKKALNDAGLSNTQEILQYFNISKYGNFENHTTNPYLSQEKVPKNIELAKKTLKHLRGEVTYPFIDSKMSTSWNALMASALFEAGNIDEKYSKQAISLVENILNKLQKNGVLYHQVLPNSTLKVTGLLEDYSFLIDALIKANQYTQNKKYLHVATTLLNSAIHKFYKDEIWYLSDGSFTSQASLQDASYKSAMAKMIQNVFVISLLNGDTALHNLAIQNLENISSQIKNNPGAYPEAIKIVLMDKKALILLKGKQERLHELRNIKKEIDYPYMYILEVDENILQACSNNECFSFSKDSNILKEGIKKYLK